MGITLAMIVLLGAMFLKIPVLAPHRLGGRSLNDQERELCIWHHLTDELPVVLVEISLAYTRLRPLVIAVVADFV